MGLKLNTASSGSVTIEPANTASNYTLTVPAQTGTVVATDASGNASISGNLSFNSGYGSAATAYGCRAWVNFNGTGTVSINGSGNVSSITDRGTGAYTVNFSTAMPDANYSAVYGMIGTNPYEVSGGRTSSSYQINTENNSYTQFDPTGVSVAIFR